MFKFLSQFLYLENKICFCIFLFLELFFLVQHELDKEGFEQGGEGKHVKPVNQIWICIWLFFFLIAGMEMVIQFSLAFISSFRVNIDQLIELWYILYFPISASQFLKGTYYTFQLKVRCSPQHEKIYLQQSHLTVVLLDELQWESKPKVYLQSPLMLLFLPARKFYSKAKSG